MQYHLRAMMAVVAIAVAVHAMDPGGGGGHGITLPEGYEPPEGYTVLQPIEDDSGAYDLLLENTTPPTDGNGGIAVADFVLLRDADGELWYDCVVCRRPCKGGRNKNPTKVYSYVKGIKIVFSESALPIAAIAAPCARLT